MSESELIELLAEWSHKSWSGWTRWMIDKWSPEMVTRWERQIATPYAVLSEKEKESDRKEARAILDILRRHGALVEMRGRNVPNA